MNQKEELSPLEQISEKLCKIRSKNILHDEKKGKSDYSALNVCSDLIAGILVGGIVGFQLDKYFNTKPILFIICFIFGNIASGVLIYKNFRK
ncbi:MAG: AtpZ/AtpI family protein [Alphaproteobacteria bacterium]